MKVNFDTQPDFSSSVLRLPALSHVSEQDVEEAFEIVCDNMPAHDRMDEELLSILNTRTLEEDKEEVMSIINHLCFPYMFGINSSLPEMVLPEQQMQLKDGTLVCRPYSSVTIQ